jgi:hypothetical protein
MAALVCMNKATRLGQSGGMFLGSYTWYFNFIDQPQYWISSRNQNRDKYKTENIKVT